MALGESLSLILRIVGVLTAHEGRLLTDCKCREDNARARRCARRLCCVADLLKRAGAMKNDERLSTLIMLAFSSPTRPMMSVSFRIKSANLTPCAGKSKHLLPRKAPLTLILGKLKTDPTTSADLLTNAADEELRSRANFFFDDAKAGPRNDTCPVYTAMRVK